MEYVAKASVTSTCAQGRRTRLFADRAIAVDEFSIKGGCGPERIERAAAILEWVSGAIGGQFH